MAKLTPKQELFIQYYMISLNATDSYKKAGYNCSTDNAAGVEAFKLLRNPKIKNEIDYRLAKKATDNGITMDYVLQGIKAIADSGERENDKLKAYELLGKHLKLFTDKVETENTNLNYDMSNLTDAELEAEIEKLKSK